MFPIHSRDSFCIVLLVLVSLNSIFENPYTRSLFHLYQIKPLHLYPKTILYDLTHILIRMVPHDYGIEVSLTDYDVERFDPTGAGRVDVEAPLEERTPGGLGLYLVLKMVDSIHYEYRNRQSKITFIVDRKN